MKILFIGTLMIIYILACYGLGKLLDRALGGEDRNKK